MKLRYLAALGVAMGVLSACSSNMSAAWQTLREAVPGKRDLVATNLNPNFRYLRVTLDGRSVVVALGNVDGDPRNPVEVWYSGQREVLRLQGGRVVGATGTTTEWRQVKLTEFPAWSVIARGGEAFRWTRTRDVMPGYRYGVREEMVVRAIPAPASTELVEIEPRQLAWFEERVERASGVDAPLSPARYAVDMQDGRERVVYAEQCLAADLCIAWQRWRDKQ